MEKPTIFFSHSAKDRNVILPIKEKLIKITSGVSCRVMGKVFRLETTGYTK